ncbi:Eco57I restriction-modification methylase domain-containing protein [Sphingobacterium faecium]|uniref:Eco57I restriction-modification methylase domain-containing protein n=1 Tax=Sphingobacterium faecium TaxID=34087 RepID=UPI003207D8B0
MTITEIRYILESPYNREDWKKFLKNQFTNNKLNVEDRIIALADKTISKQCLSLGNYEINEYTKIGIFEIQLNDKVNLSRNRVALRNLLKDITQQMAGAMVVFVKDEKWRFSYISKRKFKNKDTNNIEDKETAPKRFTYLFGKGEKALTAAQRFDKLIQKQKSNLFDLLSLDDFEEAFSVEKLGKEFFKHYKDIYEDFVEYITGDRFVKKGSKITVSKIHEPHFDFYDIFNEDDKAVRDFFKRMLGRIVFLYFIQKKGWLAVPKGENWDKGNSEYLYQLFKNAKYKELFYSDYLVPLFFETLNDPKSEDENRDFRFPYLNGGLFDKSQDKEFDKLALPSKIFDKLFETFNNFNFTIYEDAPDEHTVAVDPEMLGHIFENLLEDNKAKGAFYTPKEIVHYMSKESLKTYLISKQDLCAKQDLVAESAINKIIQQQELDNFEIKYAQKNAFRIIDALKQVKICDPAIGSGAFPMGLLQEIFNLHIFLMELSGFTKTISESEIKKHIIEESIYGIDIDAGAVDISRLRFWLSLVVDEPKPQPLPNLSFKIVCANTLIPLGKASGDLGGSLVVALEIQRIRDLYFNASKDEKKDLERQFRNLQNKLWTTSREWANGNDAEIYRKISEFNPFEDKSCSWFDSWWMFGVKNGFDIVIGNPPYGAKLNKLEKKVFKELYDDVHMRTPDTFNYFISKSFRLLKNNGVLSFIVPNNLLFQNENTKTRSLLINTNILKSVINLGDNTFENADVPTCIFVAIKQQNEDYFIEYSDYRRDHIQNIDFFKSQKILTNIDVNDVPDLVIGVSEQGVKIIKEISEKSYKIDDIALEVASGISSGGDKIFRISNEFAIDNKFEFEILRPVLLGSEIDKFKTNCRNHKIIYTARDTKIENYGFIMKYLLNFKSKLESRSEAKEGIMPWYSLNRHRYPGLFEERKIIMRQTSDRIRATIDDLGFYCLDSILILKINPQLNVSYNYSLLILNSKLNHFVYKNITQEEGRVFAQVKPQNVRKLFIPIISLEEQKVFDILCEYMLFLNDEGNSLVNSRIENKSIAHFLQQIIDACVVELIYGDEMKNKEVDILKYVRKDIFLLDEYVSKRNNLEQIYELHQKWTLPNDEIRNRLKIISVMCPDTAGKILNVNEEN